MHLNAHQIMHLEAHDLWAVMGPDSADLGGGSSLRMRFAVQGAVSPQLLINGPEII